MCKKKWRKPSLQIISIVKSTKFGGINVDDGGGYSAES